MARRSIARAPRIAALVLPPVLPIPTAPASPAAAWRSPAPPNATRSLPISTRDGVSGRLASRQMPVGHWLAERVPAQPVEPRLRGEQLHPVARAPQLVAARDRARRRREPEAHGADRLLGRAAVGSGDAGGGEAHVRTERAPR